MKKISLSIVICSSALLLAACSPGNENPETTETKQTQNEQVGAEDIEVPEENKEAKSYAVSGMVCEFGCAKFIEEEVAGQFGVLDFKVNYEEETAEIVYDKSRTSSEEIIAFVETLNEGKYNMVELEAGLENVPLDTESQKDSVASPEMEGTAKVSIPRMDNFRFSFPKVITYFMRRL